MKRSLSRTLSPGLWAAVGGHLEPGEIGNPLAACEREIFEETGISASEISGLHLQYVLIRLNETEIRQQFFFTGLMDKHPVIATDEGELHWISRWNAPSLIYFGVFLSIISNMAIMSIPG
ncbi:NUDIX domain-containing protein [Paenibacillus sp. GP183]|uniref:NUDIX hydrolase n=1 Tax=Paenibacillus sp. GP183 TaxID=1882751 RepID=UPI00209AC405|nr:NUDIX domain-containing protein [Paenibacillus sp. GP183]